MELEKFKKTVLPLRDKLLNVSLKLLAEKADAEDVVQDAFLKLWHMRNRLEHYRSVEALAVMMVKNLSLDLIRKRKPEEDWMAEITVDKEAERPDIILEQMELTMLFRVNFNFMKAKTCFYLI